MSNYRELKAEFDAVQPENLCAIGVADAVIAEQKFRYWLLKLLFEIHGDMDSLAASYRELVKMQRERGPKVK